MITNSSSVLPTSQVSSIGLSAYKTQKLVVDGVNKFEYFRRSSWGGHSFNAISAYFFLDRGYERYESIMKKLKKR